MARRSNKRPWGQEHRALDLGRLGAMPRSERGFDGGDYQVQRIRGSKKTYTCPACHQPVPAGTAHVVAWPEEARFGLPQGVDARRHWHSACWDRRLRPL